MAADHVELSANGHGPGRLSVGWYRSAGCPGAIRANRGIIDLQRVAINQASQGPADHVQLPVDHRTGHGGPGRQHGCFVAPGVGGRVVRLQLVGRVVVVGVDSTAHDVDLAVDGGAKQACAGEVGRRLRAPGVGGRVVAFHVRRCRFPRSLAADHVDLAVEQRAGPVVALLGKRAERRPFATRGRAIVILHGNGN